MKQCGRKIISDTITELRRQLSDAISEHDDMIQEIKMWIISPNELCKAQNIIERKQLEIERLFKAIKKEQEEQNERHIKTHLPA